MVRTVFLLFLIETATATLSFGRQDGDLIFMKNSCQMFSLAGSSFLASENQPVFSTDKYLNQCFLTAKSLRGFLIACVR